MNYKSSLAPDGEAIKQLKTSASAGRLVAVVGTGCSMALTDSKIPALSWKGLVENGLAYGKKKGKITSTQVDTSKRQLNSVDLDDLLNAAEFVSVKLGAPDGILYTRWLESVFKSVEASENEMAKAIRALYAAGVPICTLNYDHLLERVTGLTSINLNDTDTVVAWMRRESQGIVHLHGSWNAPSTCILGIRDYQTARTDEVRDLIQRDLSTFNLLGCGDTFADPNFSALINWLREKMKTATPQHYALVREDQLATRHADPAWHGFVEPISLHGDHTCLPAFLLQHFTTPVAKKTGTATLPPKPKTEPRHPIGDDKEHRFFVKSTHAKYIMGEESSEIAKLRVIRALKDVGILRIDRAPTHFQQLATDPTTIFPIRQECFSIPGVALKTKEYYNVVLGDDQIFKANKDYTYFISFELRAKLDVLHDNPETDFIQLEKPFGTEILVVEVHFPPSRKLKRVNRKVQLSVHEVRHSDPNSIDGKWVLKEIESTRYMVNADDTIETIPGTFTDMFRLTLLNPPQGADYIRITWQWSRNAEIQTETRPGT